MAVMPWSLGRRLLALLLMVVLLAGLFTPTPQVLGQTKKDRRAVAADTISAVIEGLRTLRSYLEGRGAPAEALAALDIAIQNLQGVLQVLAETGDVGLAQAALHTSAREVGRVGPALPPEAEGDVRLTQAIERAIERAEEIGRKVAEVQDPALRQQLQGELQRATTLLGRAADALKRGDMREATEAYRQAVGILGSVVAGLNRARELDVERQRDIAMEVREMVEELREKIEELREDIGESPISEGLRGELLAQVVEAENLIRAAEEAIGRGEVGAALGSLGRALAIANEVEARLKTALKALSLVREEVERVLEGARELGEKLAQSGLPGPVVERVRAALDEAIRLAQQALTLAEQGRPGEALSILAQARMSLQEASRLIKQLAAEREGGAAEAIEVRAELKEKGVIQVEIKNKGDEAITIIALRVYLGHREVQVRWDDGCRGPLNPGGELTCTGRLEFRMHEIYRVVITIQRGSEVQELVVRVKA